MPMPDRGPAAAMRSGRRLSSLSSSSAGRRRSSSAASASVVSSSSTEKRPLASSSTAMPNRGRRRAVSLGNRAQQVFATLVEQRLVGQRAGGHHPHHLALDGSLGLGGVADLLADGHGDTVPDELGQIALGGVIGHTGHRDRPPGGLAALGQRDVEQGGGALGVVVEQFVEVAHPIEQQHARMLRLDAQILLHHRRVLRCGGNFARGCVGRFAGIGIGGGLAHR